MVVDPCTLSTMRLVYFGSGAFGLPTLERLASDHTIVGIVSQPDRPAGRGAKSSPTAAASWAAKNLPNVPTLKPERVREPGIVGQIRAWAAEAWVVIAFGQKLPQELLEGTFAVNLHASLLPRWRGAAPINTAILSGDTVTGNTVITLADRMDAGLILGTTTRSIDPLVTAGELHDLLAADGPDLVSRVLAEFQTGLLSPRSQDESQVTIATKLSKSDDDIDFHQPADFLRREIHALTPWPGISVQILSTPTIPLKLFRAKVGANIDQATEPGTILEPKSGLVACGHGTTLQILEVQPPGKRPMSWSAFANGRPVVPNTVMVSARELA